MLNQFTESYWNITEFPNPCLISTTVQENVFNEIKMREQHQNLPNHDMLLLDVIQLLLDVIQLLLDVIQLLLVVIQLLCHC